MSRIEQILFPIDFSQRSINAAPHINAWAARFSAEVIALHVMEPGNYFTCCDLENPGVHEELANLTAQRVSDLNYFCNHYLSNNNRVRNVVANGSAAELIVAIAENENASLIMLPRGHQSAVSRWLHDSVTARVLDACPTPVWTSDKLDRLPVLPIRQIVCAVHVDDDLLLDAANKRLLDFASFVARKFDAAVTCLYVAKSRRDRDIPAISARLANIRHELHGMAEFETAYGCVQEAIIEVAKRRSADVVMLGRTRIGTVGLVQSHILKIDHDARCPVVSVL